MSLNRIRPDVISTQFGFTLIEILVALVVLSVGLLGLAGMQLTGLRYNYGAYSRTQATLMAYDIIDRMRANSDGVAAGAYDAINTTTAPTGTLACVSSTNGCTPAQLAEVDKYEWSQLFNGTPPLLAGASATVTNVAGTFTVAVTWREREGSATGTSNKIISISVQP